MAGKSLFKNVIANGLLSMFNVVLPFVVTPYVYRVFGPFNIGSYEYANTILGYFSMLGLLGIYDYGVRSISANRHKIDIRDSIFKNLFIIGILSNILILLFYILFIKYFIHNYLIRSISYILCLNLFSQTFQVEWFNVGMEEFKFITEKTIIIRLINVLGIFCFIRSENNLLLYVGFSVGMIILNYIVSFIYVIRTINRPLIYFIKDLNLRIYILPLLIILVLKNTGVMYTLADKIILGYAKGSESVAFFSIGQKIVELSKALLMSIVYATMPRLSYYLQTDQHLYTESIKRIIRLVTCLAIPMGIGLFCLSDEIVVAFGGESFSPASWAMRVFSIRVILSCIETIMYSQILFLHGKEKRLLCYNIICGFINISLNIILIRQISPFLSIFCTLISELLFNSLILWYISNDLKIKTDLFSWSTLRYVAISVLFIPLVLGVKYFIYNRSLNMIVSIILCMSLYFSVLALVRDRAYMELKEYSLKILTPIVNFKINKSNDKKGISK